MNTTTLPTRRSDCMLFLLIAMTGLGLDMLAHHYVKGQINLLPNAARFYPHRATVEVSLLKQEAQVRIEVTDHGSGIPRTFQARTFQKFSQANAPALSTFPWVESRDLPRILTVEGDTDMAHMFGQLLEAIGGKTGPPVNQGELT